MEHGPIWIIRDPVRPYPDSRFDAFFPPLNPNQPMPELCRDCGKLALDPAHYHDGEGGCEWCCPICQNEQIADAAREALPDMLDVLQNWGYIQTYPLTWMKKLVALLRPPAYYEQAKESQP